MKKNFVMFALAVLVLAGPALAQNKDVSQIGNSSPYTFQGATGDHCATGPVAIPDLGNANLSQTISGNQALGLDVSVAISHTWVGDLKVTLTNNTSALAVVIIDRPGFTGTGFGCANNDIDTVISDAGGAPVENQCAVGPPAIGAGPFTPNNPLSAFDGRCLTGDWTLNVSDHAAGDVGTINSWCLTGEGDPCGGTTTGGTGGGDTGGTGTPATNVWGVGILIALFLGVSLFYLRRRGASPA